MRVAVVGIANVETVVPVERFPVPYEPTRYLPGRIRTGVGGVGFNVARALAGLGADVVLTAPLGDDLAGDAVRDEAAALGLALREVATPGTPRSVVLVDTEGRRQVNTDLGGALDVAVDASSLMVRGSPADVAVLGNLDFSRPLLPLARASGVTTAVDLQDVQALDHPYDRDFVAGADVLLMSDERLAGPPEDVVRAMLDQSQARFVVLGLGAHGNLAWERGAAAPVRTAAPPLPTGTDTTGAGDALLAGVVRYALGDRLLLESAMARATAFVAEALSRRSAPPA